MRRQMFSPITSEVKLDRVCMGKWVLPVSDRRPTAKAPVVDMSLAQAGAWRVMLGVAVIPGGGIVG